MAWQNYGKRPRNVLHAKDFLRSFIIAMQKCMGHPALRNSGVIQQWYFIEHRRICMLEYFSPEEVEVKKRESPLENPEWY
jgi:hypothetical protein